ncbi:hypothetical protein K490DRAFT_63891 [Saccharata proteae CBS 121410]|uniref:Uncharacterized protein n=1 Tax=Saccharata proteae CBS 121410 TaxID=1314787 RepID=A0A6A5YDI1_9PEZI|nr:hypothetical protein K490DRAFT_63891 [Saccharata proteae CBS 121410]
MSTLSASKPTSFFDLPRELRDIIYGLALHPFETATTIGIAQPYCPHAPPRQTLPKAFTETQTVSKLFAEEAKYVFYRYAIVTQLATLDANSTSPEIGLDMIRWAMDLGCPHIALPDRPDLSFVENLEIRVLIPAARGVSTCILCDCRRQNTYASTDSYDTRFSRLTDSSAEDSDSCDEASNISTRHSGILLRQHEAPHTAVRFVAINDTTSTTACAAPVKYSKHKPQIPDLIALRNFTLKFTTERNRIGDYSCRIPILRQLMNDYERFLGRGTLPNGRRDYNSSPRKALDAHTGFGTRCDIAEVLFRLGWSRDDVANHIGRPLVWQVDPPLALQGRLQKWMLEGKSHRDMMALEDAFKKETPKAEQPSKLIGREKRSPERFWTRRPATGRDRDWQVIAMEAWGAHRLEVSIRAGLFSMR